MTSRYPLTVTSWEHLAPTETTTDAVGSSGHSTSHPHASLACALCKLSLFTGTLCRVMPSPFATVSPASDAKQARRRGGRHTRRACRRASAACVLCTPWPGSCRCVASCSAAWPLLGTSHHLRRAVQSSNNVLSGCFDEGWSPDPGLTKLGVAQARAVATHFGGIHARRPIEGILTSPMARALEVGRRGLARPTVQLITPAIQTARPIAAACPGAQCSVGGTHTSAPACWLHRA